MQKLKLLLFTVITAVLFSNCTSSKSWVHAMDDPNANYHKACKNFDKYWSKHLAVNNDKEENETPGEKSKESVEDPRPFLVKVFQSEEQAQENSNSLHMQQKKFLKWRLENKAYVKADGTLMTVEERLKVWEQLNNMKKDQKDQ